MIKKKFLFSTSKDNKYKSQKIIIEAIKLKEESISIEKIGIIRSPKIRISISCLVNFLMFIIKSILSGKFFGTEFTKSNYKKVRIGKYAVSASFRSIKSYKYKIIYYLLLIRSIYSCIFRVDEFLKIKNNISAVYANEVYYINGVYRDLAIIFNIPFYTHGYPFNLSRFFGAKCDQLDDYNLVDTNLNFNSNIGKKKLEEITNDTNKISYMAGLKFYNKYNEIDFRDAYAVIYAHSFTDAQQAFKVDSNFLNMYDWLKFTISELNNKKIILKAHPYFYMDGYESQVIEWDKIIWKNLIKKFSKKNLIEVIDWPMQNLELLKKVSKKTLLISHHGNALLEGGGLGFKCICSSFTPWAKFDLFNTWNSKQQYSKMLKKKIELQETKIQNLYRYIGNAYLSKQSIHSQEEWRKVIAKYMGKTSIELTSNPSLINNLNDLDVNKLALKISKNINSLDLR
jgi:hypothetical protein